MPISFAPMREFMKKNGISYYYLANQGIDAGTLQRLRHDEVVTTKTLANLCRIMRCTPAELICYVEEAEE